MNAKEESALILHAKREMAAIGYAPTDVDQEDGPNLWIQQNVLELLRVFSKQGHSGSSAPYCIEMFTKLALFKPLGPLTGEDSEWVEVGEGLFQNVRCSRVFKDATGRAYDIDGIVFRDANGTTYTSKESHVDVSFPYWPTTVYVDRA